MNLRSLMSEGYSVLYHALKGRWPLRKPVVLQFPINDICNAHCQMCNIWERKKDMELSPEQLATVLRDPLFSELQVVGVNGGEPTLRKDIGDLVEALFTTLPKLKHISLITNALNAGQVIRQVQNVAEVVERHSGSLDVMISLDGIGSVHDKVRGREGAFENAVEVVQFVKGNPLISTMRLGCTVVKDNVYQLHDLLDFAIREDVYIKFRIGVPHQRLYNEESLSSFRLNMKEKVHFVIFLEGVISRYEPSQAQKDFYRSLINQMLYDAPRSAGCDWQHRGVTLSSRGELLYCAVESEVLGSVLEESAGPLYFGKQAHLADIIAQKCAACEHDYVGRPPLGKYLRQRSQGWLEKLKGFIKAHPKVFPIRLLKRGYSAREYAEREKYYQDVAAKTSRPALDGDRRGKRFLICGWYGTETLGDKAILGGVVTGVREVFPETEIVLASLFPYLSEQTVAQMSELEGVEVVSIAEALQSVQTYQAVMFGGGPVMALDCLAEMKVLFEQAKKSGILTILAGCGVGPVGEDHHNAAIKDILDLSDIRVLRDKKSEVIARSLGVEGNFVVAEDPAFTWLSKNCKDENPSSPSDEIRLLLGLRAWPFHEYAPELTVQEGNTIKERFEQQVLQALTDLCRKAQGVKILPFPMCTNHYGGDDRWFYRDLFRGCAELEPYLDLKYLSRELTPNEAIRAFLDSDVALTMRFHSLVFALGLGVPAVAIDYTLGKGKVAALAEKNSVPCRRLDLLDAEFIVSQVLKLKKTRPERGEKNMRGRLFLDLFVEQLRKVEL